MKFINKLFHHEGKTFTIQLTQLSPSYTHRPLITQQLLILHTWTYYNSVGELPKLKNYV
jgi:hypothetical protein